MSLPPPTPSERRHRGLARRLVAVRRGARYAAGGGGGGFGGLGGGGFGFVGSMGQPICGYGRPCGGDVTDHRNLSFAFTVKMATRETAAGYEYYADVLELLALWPSLLSPASVSAPESCFSIISRIREFPIRLAACCPSVHARLASSTYPCSSSSLDHSRYVSAMVCLILSVSGTCC
jgi:hypothetical protein